MILRFKVSQGEVRTLSRWGGTLNHLWMTYSLRNTKNYWNPTIMVEIIVGIVNILGRLWGSPNSHTGQWRKFAPQGKSELCLWPLALNVDPYLVAFYCLRFRHLLNSAAPSTAVRQFGTVCYQPCAKTCHWLHIRQNWKRISSDVHNNFGRPPGAVAAVSRFRRRDISDFTYLLTYLLTYLVTYLLTYLLTFWKNGAIFEPLCEFCENSKICAAPNLG